MMLRGLPLMLQATLGDGLAFDPFSVPQVPNESATAVVILRHNASAIALDDPMWEKYKVGETLKIVDPETNAPAKKNPYLRPKPGILLVDDMAIDYPGASGRPRRLFL
jgi:hypothetical protein